MKINTKYKIILLILVNVLKIMEEKYILIQIF